MTTTQSSTSSPDSSGSRAEVEQPSETAQVKFPERALVGSLAFLTGAAILSLEILGGRMLQPYFGSGLHVWGSVLSVFMVSLALGYWLGGKLSEKKATLSRLMVFPVIGGLLLFLPPHTTGKATS